MLLFHVQVAIRSYAFGLSDEGSVALLKNCNGYTTLKRCGYPWKCGEIYQLSATVVGNTISCAINGETVIEYTDTLRPYLYGAAGAAVRGQSSCRITQLSVRGLEWGSCQCRYVDCLKITRLCSNTCELAHHG